MRKNSTPTSRATIDFKEMTDYKEGNHPDHRWVYFGALAPKYSFQLKRKLQSQETLNAYFTLGLSLGIGYGGLFNPNFRIDPQTNEPELYSYEKNKAFWAGAIDAGKMFHLVTPINHYGGYISVTIHELFWLEDNGYTFAPHPDYPGQIYAAPPVDFSERKKLIRDYLIEDQRDPKLIERLSRIIKTIEEQDPQQILVAKQPKEDKYISKKRKRNQQENFTQSELSENSDRTFTIFSTKKTAFISPQKNIQNYLEVNSI